jgi:hypothetical protein
MGKEMTEPPPLENGDAIAMAFYTQNATAFVQDFGLMPDLIDRLGLDEASRRIFLAKLSKIHETVLTMRNAEIEKASE